MSIVLIAALAVNLSFSAATSSFALSAGTYTLNDLPVGTVITDPNSTIGSTTGVKFIKVNQSPCILMTYDDYFSLGYTTYKGTGAVTGYYHTYYPYIDLDNNLYNGLSQTLKNNIIATTYQISKGYFEDSDEFSNYDAILNYISNTSKLFLPSVREIYGCDISGYYDPPLNDYTGVGQFDYFKNFGDIYSYVYPQSTDKILPFIFDKTPQPITFRDWYGNDDYTGAIYCNLMRLYYNYYNGNPNDGMRNTVLILGAGKGQTVYANYFCVQVNPNMTVYVNTNGEISTTDTAPPTITGVTVPAGWAKSKTITFNATDSSGGIQYRITDSVNTILQDWTSSTSWTVSELGTFNLYARDSLGNTTAAYSFSVTGIDNLPPLAPTININ